MPMELPPESDGSSQIEIFLGRLQQAEK